MMRKLYFNLAYLQKPVWDTGISPPELLEFISTHQPGKALDLGCGTGTNVITLAKSGWEVTGVDFVRRAINIARKNAEQFDVQADFCVDDVSRLESVTGNFDLVLDIGCFHSLPNRQRSAYIQKVDQLLADDGTFLLYAFFRDSLENVGPGITDDDIRSLTQTFTLVNRIDGTERELIKSAWLTFGKSNWLKLRRKNAAEKQE